MTQGRRNIAPAVPVLPNPPSEYNQNYMNRLVNAVQSALQFLENPSTLRGGWLNLSAVKYSAFGLTSGDIWIEGNVLKIVRDGDTGVLGSGVSILSGTVTVTT